MSDIPLRDSERILWVNVVLQAVRDATDGMTSPKNSRDTERRRARAWFSLSNPDFIEVCHCAHLDPDATYQSAMSAIARYDQIIAAGETYSIDRKAGEKPKQQRIVRRYTIGDRSHTVAEWAKISGVQDQTIRQRLQRGLSIEAAISPKIKKTPFQPRAIGRPAELYTIDGVSKTINQWAAHHGLDAALVGQRLQRGYSIEKALSKTRVSRPAKLYTINGVSKTFAEWAAHAGISTNVLYARMNKGRSLAEAVAMPKRGSKGAGVVSNLDPILGTGAGSTAQEIPEITFSDSEVSQ